MSHAAFTIRELPDEEHVCREWKRVADGSWEDVSEKSIRRNLFWTNRKSPWFSKKNQGDFMLIIGFKIGFSQNQIFRNMEGVSWADS